MLGHSEDVVNLGAAMASQLSLVETEISSTSTVLLTAVREARVDTTTELALVSRDSRAASAPWGGL